MSDGTGFVIARSHPALAGHFPDLAVVPGSVILEQVLAAWGRPCGTIPAAKFHLPLGPDQPVEVRFAPARTDGVVAFDCRRETELICSGLIQVAPAA